MGRELAEEPSLDVSYWSASLLACCVAAAVWAGFAPLADPDLPMHLAVGEWIAAHRQVPFVEPFAWTRPGEPYYAYSWLAQAVFYVVMRATGPVGLHFLAALCGVAIVLAGFAAGRAMGLGRWRAVVLGCLSIGIAMESTPFLRPQLLMHAFLPLAWALAIRLGDPSSKKAGWLFVSLWIVSALAAATHITFLATAAPIVVLLARADRGAIPRVGAAAVAIAAGWLTSPYAAVWPKVFALNLGYNAITAGQSPAGELAPGFAVAPLVGGLLAVLPLLVDIKSRRAVERVALGGLWLVGLVVFARYFKGLSPWWWCALPMVALALARLPEFSSQHVARLWCFVLPLVVLAFSPTNVRLWRATHQLEGDAVTRKLPSLKAFAAEPVAGWLETNVRIPEGTRVLTTFNFGSYLKWRLPAISESIDSRGVFPDSVALPDVPSVRGDQPTGPWRSSTVAVVPADYPVAKLLDSDPQWCRVGTAAPAPWAPHATRVTLWAKCDWLRANRLSRTSFNFTLTK